ncbi:MAG: hypothetical protein LBQ92_03925 [Propionibacteriaceae bacterium]|jgi:hypothetical protein|nr:hypothetical protein [Propionibacteriaceae bacterium]
MAAQASQMGIITTAGNGGQPLAKTEPEPTIGVEDYAPPRSKAPWLVALALAVTAALIAWLSIGRPQLNVEATPAPSAAAATEPSWGTPFEFPYGEATGRWEVAQYEWDADGLEVQVRLLADDDLDFSLRVLEYNTGYGAEAAQPYHEPVLASTSLAAGEEVSGWVRFYVWRQDVNLVLSTRWGEQASAIKIPG